MDFPEIDRDRNFAKEKKYKEIRKFENQFKKKFDVEIMEIVHDDIQLLLKLLYSIPLTN